MIFHMLSIAMKFTQEELNVLCEFSLDNIYSYNPTHPIYRFFGTGHQEKMSVKYLPPYTPLL